MAPNRPPRLGAAPPRPPQPISDARAAVTPRATIVAVASLLVALTLGSHAGAVSAPGGARGLPLAVSDLSVTVTDSPDPVSAGAPLQYVLDVSNAGPDPAAAVVLTDTLPAGVTFGSATGLDWTCDESTGTVTCTRDDAAVGSVPGVTIVVTAPAEGASLTNEAAVASSTSDPDLGNNEDSQLTDVTPSADLSVSTTDAPDPVLSGASLVYTLSVTNAGPSSATDLVLTDTLPAQAVYVSASGTGWSCNHAAGAVTCTRAAAAIGPVPDVTITVTAPAQGGSLTNQASISSSTADPTPGNDTATEMTGLTRVADLALDKAGPVSVVAGNQVVYTLTVTNAGPSIATDLVLTDDLPANATYVSASGTRWTCEHATGTVTCSRNSLGVTTAPAVTIRVNPLVSATSLTNDADVTSNIFDPDTGDNDDSVTTTQSPSADVSVSSADAPDPVRVGSPLTYTFTVANTGPSPATGVQLVATVPANTVFASAGSSQGSCSRNAGQVTCTIGSIASGDDVAVTLVVTPTAPGTRTSTATATHAEADPVAGNDQASEQTTVQGSACTIVGTQGPDASLNGTSGADVVCGLAGNDTINASGGVDIVYAGLGEDTLDGGAGGDSLYGQAGADSLDGDTGFDYARYDGSPASVTANLANGIASGGENTDALTGIEGVVGSRFADTLTGDPLDNIIEGGKGNDVLNGAGGRDGASYALATAGVTVSLETGTTSGADNTDSLANFEDVYGSAFPDSLTGSASNNALHGLGGNDGLNGAGGFDFARYDSAPSGITANLTTDVSSGPHGNDAFTSIEGLAGSAFGDELTGDGVTNTLIGGGGNDVLDGAGGTDFASYVATASAVNVNLAAGTSGGGDGNDTLTRVEGVFGSAFGDTIAGGPAGEVLEGGGGNDVIGGGDGDDHLTGGTGNDSLTGGGGSDATRYDDAASAVAVNLATGTATGGDGSDALTTIEDVYGSAFNDTITGSPARNLLDGGVGNDALAGGKQGDDLRGRAGIDSIAGGKGFDFVLYDTASGAVNVNLATASATGADGLDSFATIEGVLGSSFNDTIAGSDLAETLFGGAGNDAISGSKGADNLWGGTGNDTISGGDGFDYARYDNATSPVTVRLGSGTSTGEGADTLAGVEGVVGSAFADLLNGSGAGESLFGRSGADTISGASGNDDLFGEGGNDGLAGGAGNDSLRGGGGNDQMNGGTGTDDCNQGPGTGTQKSCETTRVTAETTVTPSAETTRTVLPAANAPAGGTPLRGIEG